MQIVSAFDRDAEAAYLANEIEDLLLRCEAALQGSAQWPLLDGSWTAA
jgi:hypothetical protein